VGSELGLSDEKLVAVLNWPARDLFDDDERLALEYADAITLSDRDVDDKLFARLRGRWDDDTLVELTEIIAWENASSKFNRALRIPSQNLWRTPPPAASR
jgi:alkylhydroperoxidase family enzyme